MSEREFKKPCQNNLDNFSDVGAAVGRAKFTSISLAHNRRVEIAYARPCFDKKRTVTIANLGTSDVIPPPADKWNGEGYSGMNGYIRLLDGSGDVIPTATIDLELWAYDEQQNRWFRVETKQDVSTDQEVRFQDAVRWRKGFVRISDPQNAPITAEMFFTWE